MDYTHPTTPAQPATLNPTTAAKLASVDHELVGDVLIVPSTKVIGKLYRVTEHGCTCPSATYRLTCWHMSARAYLLAQQPAATTAGPRTPDEIDQAEVQRQVAAMRQAGAQRIGDKKTERVRQ